MTVFGGLVQFARSSSSCVIGLDLHVSGESGPRARWGQHWVHLYGWHVFFLGRPSGPHPHRPAAPPPQRPTAALAGINSTSVYHLIHMKSVKFMTRVIVLHNHSQFLITIALLHLLLIAGPGSTAPGRSEESVPRGRHSFHCRQVTGCTSL